MTPLPLPIRNAGLLASCIALSACANMSGLGGSAEYGCKAPTGVRCESVSGNYYNAVKNNLPGQRRRDQPHAESDTHPEPAEASAASGTAVSIPKTSNIANPLRAQSRVLRLWFKPWEDADRDLYDQGFVYVQVDGGRWLIDHVQQRIRDVYAPIRPPRSAALPADSTSKPADPRQPGTGTPNAQSGLPALPALPSKPLPGAPGRSADDSE